MKAFHFRLNRVLEWRETERRLAASRAEAAISVLARVRSELATIEGALLRGPGSNPSGADLANWAGWKITLNRHLQNARKRVAAAQAALQQEQAALLEANRRVKLLGKLKDAELTAWRRDLDRELSTLASEVHLAGFNRRATIEQAGA